MKPLLARSIAMRRSQFEALPKVADAVVFLGDSITEGGVWDEWFRELLTLNRGIGGDTVGGVLDRLDSALYEPRAISLLIGTNDLTGMGRSFKVDDIAELNRRDEKLAGVYGATYLDLWPSLVGPDRALRKDVSRDGTHLNGNGYRIWVDILRPHLAPFA